MEAPGRAESKRWINSLRKIVEGGVRIPKTPGKVKYLFIENV